MSNAQSHKAARRIVRLALTIGIAVIGRVLFQPLPNIQPVTVIIMLVTLYLGLMDGLMVAVGSILVSNIFMGMGPWTIGQIISFSIVVVLTYLLLKPIYDRKLPYRRYYGVITAILMGLIYGLIISLWSVWLYKINHFWVYYFRGISFDLMHALGNGAFYFVLEPILSKILTKQSD
ncbi:ECF transporter S component [Aerococcaceae bacterium DSM 111176]|nr:ECF transporter S component [Aerococcaceae bacterium DSM 111176]